MRDDATAPATTNFRATTYYFSVKLKGEKHRSEETAFRRSSPCMARLPG